MDVFAIIVNGLKPLLLFQKLDLRCFDPSFLLNLDFVSSMVQPEY